MADLGNTAVISPTDASNGSGTMPSWLGSAAPSTLDDAGRAIQGAVAREWENRSFPTATGTAPAFVVTYTVAPAALRSGQTYTFTAHAAAVGTDTLNANTLGAKGIKKVVAGVKTATAANDWYTGDKISCVYDGTDMVWNNKGFAADLAAYTLGAASATDNAIARFDGTGGKTIQNSAVVIADAGDTTITSTDAGATVSPLLTLDRFSASPANSDVLGGVAFVGRDSGAGTQTYAQIQSTITDVTAASEDATLNIQTVVAGTVATRVNVGAGLYTEGVTGGDKGAGTINATAYYKAGDALSVPPTRVYKTADETMTTDTTFQSDDHLLFAVAASTDYMVEFVINLLTGTSAGIKTQLTGPASPTEVIINSHLSSGADASKTILAAAFSTSMAHPSTLTAAGGRLTITALIRNGLNAGTVTLQWAQNASSGATTMKKGSYVEYQIIA